jgi:hypothetical protein
MKDNRRPRNAINVDCGEEETLKELKESGQISDSDTRILL